MMFFATAYFLQGATLAYIINFQKPYLMVQGIDKSSMGLLTSLMLIPFVAKVFLGMLSDRLPLFGLGSRKPYMLIGLLIFALSYAIAGLVDPGKNFFLFGTFSFLASMGLALFDTCADGWAIDVSSEQEEGGIQASMLAGKSFGLIAMSGFFGLLAMRFGFPIVFFTLSAMAIAVGVIVWVTPYKGQKPSEGFQTKAWRQWLTPTFMTFGLFGFLYSIGSFGTDGLQTLFLAETAGADMKTIGTFGALRGGGALLGAVAFGLFYQKLGIRKALTLSLVLLGAGALWPVFDLPWIASAVIWGALWAFQETAYVTLAMRFSKGAFAATFFAIFMIFSNLGTSIGEALAAPLVPEIGYAGVFTTFAGVIWICLIFVRTITPRDHH